MINNKQQPNLVECPRDAMQGWPHPISTDRKIKYLSALINVGFDTIDFGSFVSPKAIPQMADTAQVIKAIDHLESQSSLLAIVANLRGAAEAIVYDRIQYLGFPFSISETFQQRNTNSSIIESFSTVAEMQNLCIKSGKILVVYLSMGFGNPYGDPYDEGIVLHWVQKMHELGVEIISIADTVGLADSAQVKRILETVIPAYKDVQIGVHLHASPASRSEKIQAAIDAGCIRYDAAINGIGGCPMAGDELIGNMDTDALLTQLLQNEIPISINMEQLAYCRQMATEIFI